jgi:hypothetical protein
VHFLENCLKTEGTTVVAKVAVMLGLEKEISEKFIDIFTKACLRRLLF